MALMTLGPMVGWAVGETITAYKRDTRNVIVGSAIDTAAVGADGTTTFDSLEHGQKYIATDGTVEVRFGTTAVPGAPGSKGVVQWDSGAIPMRPERCESVDWIGPDDPAVNAFDGDTWTSA